MTDHANEIMRRAREAQDEGQGVVARPPRNTFVPATVRHDLPAAVHETTLDVPMSAQAAVVVRTSAVDRAKGFAIGLRELGFVLGALAVIVGVVGWRIPLVSLTTLTIFGVTYALAWAGGWFWSQLISPEGVMLFEAKRKWDEVRDARRERWGYWAQAHGFDPHAQRRTLLDSLLHPAVLTVGILCATALLLLGLYLTFGW
jgi:hypothetical protein